MWAQSLTHLVLIFRLAAPSFCTLEWQRKLRKHNCVPSQYTFERFLKSGAVYLKLRFPLHAKSNQGVQSNMAYVGSTTLLIQEREANRVAKLRQVSKAKLVKAELALRWWIEKRNYFSFSTIVLNNPASKLEGLALEHALIAKWQPKLNFPSIVSHFKRTALGYVKTRCTAKHQTSVVGGRLFKRTRRFHTSMCLKGLKSGPRRIITHKQAWALLFSLSQMSKASYDASRHIRSLQFSTVELYALFRLAANLEEPARSRTRSVIKSAMIFRKLSIPKSNLPFSIPFLSHDGFTRSLKLFLRSLIITYKAHGIPFHLASSSPRETSHQQLGKRLFNFNSWMNQVDDTCPQQSWCQCRSILRRHPNLELVDGHIASSASKLSVSAHLMPILTANQTSTFFPAKRFYVDNSVETFRRWLIHHGLPQHLTSRWLSFVDQEWPHHCKHLADHTCFSAQDVFQLLRELPVNLVRHNADKEASHLMVYCPMLYCNVFKSTWEDENVFAPLRMSPAEAVPMFLSMVPTRFWLRYKWGISVRGTAPYGYGFLKRKKSFKVVRTIISYAGTPFCQLFKATAIVLQHVLEYTWPQMLGLQKSPMIWTTLHRFLDSAGSDKYAVVNDDLVGFFNAIPQDRIIKAVSDLLRDYFEKLGRSPEDAPKALTVNVNLPSAESRVFQGRVRPLENFQNHCIFIEDILDVVRLSFSTGVFTAMNKCFKQIRGSSIGNQISPVLSSIAIAQYELGWQVSHANWLHQNRCLMFCARYVDNRFCVMPADLLSSKAMKEFCKPSFYGPPVELENVPDDTDFLGFVLDIEQMRTTFKLPSQNWAFRTPASAGSTRLNLGGLRARACLIRRQTWPRSLIPKYLSILCQKYRSLGFSRSDISRHATYDRW